MPPGPVTVTSTVPANPGGLVAVICVGETTTTLLAAIVPKSTTVPPFRSVPVIVTVVPPVSGPTAKLMPVTTGWYAISPEINAGPTGLPMPVARS